MKMKNYFKNLEKDIERVYEKARKARSKGYDPKKEVEVPLATSLGEKVAGLISSMYPQLNNKKFIKRIKELEEKYGSLDPAVCLSIAEEVAKEKFCKFESLEKGIDAGIRVALAYTTLGVVSSPLEGFTEFKIRKTKKGKEYFDAYYSGPIRSAGGTAGAFSLVIIDYLREKTGYAKYDPTEDEVKRMVTELYDYHERVTNLQYLPTEKEIEFLARHLPIQIGGDPSSKREVSNYKDLDRVETNRIRSGYCLVLGEGIAQKAPKILRIINKLKKKGYELKDWDWLEDFVELQKKEKIGKSKGSSAVYIKDLVAGRPVLGHPSRKGAFRLRYGRARNSGYSCLSIHPATMAILDNFIAVGSQLKIELPTKGTAVSACDSVEGPIVKLKNGSVRKVNSKKEGQNIYSSVEEIIYLGDMLVPYGDFANRNHVLMPPGYCEQEWYQELKKKKKGEIDIDNIYEVGLSKAKKLSEKFNIPLHPRFIFFWSQISYENFLALIDWLSHSRIDEKVILPYNTTERERFKKGKRALEILGVEHEVVTENVVIGREQGKALLCNLNIEVEDEKNFDEMMRYVQEKIKSKEEENVLKLVNYLSKFKIKDKVGTFIGARMGRPEKAKLRKLQGSPNVLFPVGREGGRMRSFNEACEVGEIKSEFPIYYCKKCEKETIYPRCEKCDEETKKKYYCRDCKEESFSKECIKHGTNQEYKEKKLDIKNYFDRAVEKLDLLPNEVPALVKGVRGTSNKNHVPENLVKGFLRSLFDLQVNKDGTIRIDATELPITHFKPKEIGTSVEKLIHLGYEKDIYGKKLESDEQILEIMPHDVILPSCPDSAEEGSDEVLKRTTNFIDLMLRRLYGLEPFYNVKSKEDLVGHLTACIAPHNCAGVVSRIIGFSKTQSLLASPYIHAACRRDCLGYNNYVSVKRDGKWEIDKIGKFIEKEKPKDRADNFGTLKKGMKETYTFSNPGVSKMREVTKHKPRDLFKVFLEDGREIELTGGHKVYLKGKEERRVKNLEIGDKLTISYKKEIKERDAKEIFLPEIFKNREDIMLKNVREYLSGFEKIDKNSNFGFRDSFPIRFVEKILKKNNKSLRDLPDRTKISIKRDNVSLPIRISLNNDFLEVIGLYLAEGFTRKKTGKKGFYQVSISGDKNIRERVKNVFLRYFNLSPSENHKDHATFSSRIVYELFNNYFKLGSKAREKRIPSLFLDLKKEKVAALLRGYFEGDGSVSLTDKRVTCDTVSEGLKFDLSFVLSRFKIFTKFYKYSKKPGNKVRDFYLRKNRDIPEFECNKIIIPCDFIGNFMDIGFMFNKKNSILAEIAKREGRGMRIDFDEKYVYPKIKKIERAGKKESYCLNVEKSHNFFSNDILVHNCDGDEAACMLLLDLLINFSREYLPAHRGGTQDAPLVLNGRIRAGEVDDMIFDIDVVRSLPLELYEAARKKKHPNEIDIEQIKDRLGKEEFTNLWYEYEVSDINSGVLCSAYKSLNTMQEKVQKQMELAEKIRAAETGDVARLIIDRHFIRDIRGNLRKFSQQEFRCSKCNKKFRRPPLAGICDRCKGNIIFTISEGSIVKYLEPAIQLAEKYDIPKYIQQSLLLTKRYIESIFGREKEKQEALKKWF